MYFKLIETPVLCDNLERDEVGTEGGMEVQKGWDTCIPMASSC